MKRSLTSRIAGRIARDANTARLIRVGFVTHYLSKAIGRERCRVPLRGIGPVTVRPADSDLSTIYEIFHAHEYSPPNDSVEAKLRQEYERILKSGAIPVIVDAGANIGAATLWLKTQYPEAHVVAIEPDPTSFSLLRENTRSCNNVTHIHAAVGAEPGFVRLFTEGDSWATQTERSEAGTEVVSINDALARVPNGQPFLVKVDVEGFESDLFSSNLEWLDRCHALFVEPHDWRFPGKHTSKSLQRAMGERNFELYVVRENLLYVRW